MLIGELSRRTGIPRHTIRFYERLRLLDPPPRSAAGYRHYGPEHEARLDFIRRGKLLGLGLADIGTLIRLREQGNSPCSRLRELVAHRLAALDYHIRAMLAQREELARHFERLQAAEPPPGTICGFVEETAGSRRPG